MPRKNAKGDLPGRMVLYGCFLIAFLCAVLLLLHAVNEKHATSELTLEAGDALPVWSGSALFSGREAEALDEMPDTRVPGVYTLHFRTGSRRRRVILTIEDTTPPVIEGAKDITIYVGESVAYRKDIQVNDNAGEDGVTLTVDTKQVNTSAVGEYPVRYVAVDAAGNRSEVEVTLYVKAYNQTEIKLYEEVDRVLSQVTTPEMSIERKLRAVYEYIHNHIAYVATSDKSDWITEAYRALFVTGQGDCFSYFAATKAFLTRLEVPFYEIQRKPGLTEDTHYWMLVNISETPGVERWYHYDATRLRTTYTSSGCLITDKQAEAYNRLKPYFYAYDKTGLPAVSEQIITPTPELEPYYE